MTGHDISEEISLLNRQLPKQLDSITTFTHAAYDHNARAVTFTYQVSGNRALPVEEVKAGMLAEACSDFRGRYANIKTFRLIYQSKRFADAIVEFTPSDCER